jgi:peptide/nickel transport system ATP-binding protein
MSLDERLVIVHLKDDVILQVCDLSKLYPMERGIIGTLKRRPFRYIHAVDHVTFSAAKGEILSLVGESGSGKTTTALCVLGLIDPTNGEVLFNGQKVFSLVHSRKYLELRRSMQMVFQDPYESLNPRQTVFQSVSEPMEIHQLVKNRGEKEERVAAVLEAVGLRPPEIFFDRFPEELSGGQRQRIVIAGALVLNPQLLVADEPVSMLDVSIRAGVLNLLRQLRDEHNITILYITHDLGTTSYFSDRLAVMYLGRIVEIGPTAEVLDDPYHPYTRALISVIPVPNPRRRRERLILTGEIPDPIDLPEGCRFYPRCPSALPVCRIVDPPYRLVEEGHMVSCNLYSESAL